MGVPTFSWSGTLATITLSSLNDPIFAVLNATAARAIHCYLAVSDKLVLFSESRIAALGTRVTIFKVFFKKSAFFPKYLANSHPNET